MVLSPEAGSACPARHPTRSPGSVSGLRITNPSHVAGPTDRHKFEGFCRAASGKTLCTSTSAICRLAMTPSLELPAPFIAVEGSEPGLIGLVAVEPAGPNDRVRQNSRARASRIGASNREERHVPFFRSISWNVNLRAFMFTPHRMGPSLHNYAV